MYSVPNFCDAGATPLRGIKPIFCDKFILGEVITVKVEDKDWGTVVKSISYAKDKIIAVEVIGSERAVWGGLASLNAKLNGVKAVVIDGYVRDVEDIKYLKFPVFAKGIIPNAGKPLDEGEINIKIKCGSTHIKPGDFLALDVNGAALIEREMLEEIKNKVREVKNKERKIRELILRGWNLKDILKLGDI